MFLYSHSCPDPNVFEWNEIVLGCSIIEALCFKARS